MKFSQKQGASRTNLPMLLLLAVSVIEFLLITLESRFSGIGYYLAETYLIVPCLLLLGYGLRQNLPAFAQRRLLLAAAAVSWFVIVQSIHKLSGMDNHPMATVFFVYLMAFPFAALSEDCDNRGLKWIGSMFLTASLILSGHSLLLLLEMVPAGMQEVLYWDGARLHALWHPNISACYLMIGIAFSAVFCVQADKIWSKVLLLAAIALQLFTMALTNCRTTLLLTGGLLGGIVFFRIFKGSWKQFLLGLLAAAMILVGSFKLSGMLFQWNNDRLLASFHASQEETPADTPSSADETVPSADAVPGEIVVQEDTGIIIGDNWQGSLSDDMRTLNGRTHIWKSALTAIRDNKSLALWGTEYPGTVISVYNPFPVIHAHNSWMEALLRMGIPGLLLSLVFTGLSAWCAAKLLLNMDTPLWKKIISMLTLCLMGTGFLEPYLFITNVYYHVIDFMFFFCTGYLDYWCRPSDRKP